MNSLVDQHEHARRKLDGILRTYIRQLHKRIGLANVRAAIKEASNNLSVEEIAAVVMQIAPTGYPQSKERFDEICNLLHSTLKAPGDLHG